MGAVGRIGTRASTHFFFFPPIWEVHAPMRPHTIEPEAGINEDFPGSLIGASWLPGGSPKKKYSGAPYSGLETTQKTGQCEHRALFFSSQAYSPQTKNPRGLHEGPGGTSGPPGPARGGGWTKYTKSCISRSPAPDAPRVRSLSGPGSPTFFFFPM